jgi:hypothetical protein
MRFFAVVRVVGRGIVVRLGGLKVIGSLAGGGSLLEVNFDDL